MDVHSYWRGPARWFWIVVLGLLLGTGSPEAGAAPGPSAAPRVSPLQWSPWGPAALARARSEGRLVLLDCEARWCHWCHVMDEVTYAHPAVRDTLERQWIVIKVDIDASVDLADRYGDWGWPATILLTPDLKEIRKLRGFQRPGPFLTSLRNARKLWEKTRGRGPFPDPDSNPDRSTPHPVANGDLSAQRIQALRARWEGELDRYWDGRLGGWGFKQKASTPMNVEHALVRWAHTGLVRWRERAEFTVDQQARILDPVWGGIYQYSTHGDWEHPHTEKLLSYQAGALESYARVARWTGEPRHWQRARSIYEYMNRFLSPGYGPFHVSQDADPPARAKLDGPTYYALPDDRRRAVGVPPVDTHVYARDNGMAILGLVAFSQGNEGTLLARARAVADALLLGHRAPVDLPGGPPARGFTHGPSVGSGSDPTSGPRFHLGDNVSMGRALLALYEASGHGPYLQAAKEVGLVLSHFHSDETGGGFFAHEAVAQAVGVFRERRKPLEDNALAGRFFLRLAELTSDETSRRLAGRTLAWLAAGDRPKEMGRWVGHFLTLLEEWSTPSLHLAVSGPDGPRTEALLDAVWRYRHPHLVVTRLVDAAAAASRGISTNQASVVICTRSSCSAPIRDPARLAAELDRQTRPNSKFPQRATPEPEGR